jgi:hypothetical protein
LFVLCVTREARLELKGSRKEIPEVLHRTRKEGRKEGREGGKEGRKGERGREGRKRREGGRKQKT